MPLLRRRQVLAPTNEQLLPIAHYLYGEKIKKQAAVLAPINLRAARFIERRAATLEHATDIRKIVSYDLGLVHQDLENRFSLACDVMEAVRPDVDQWLMSFLEDAAFGRNDFIETKIGECRLTAPIRQQLSETLPIWRKAIAPICEHVAGLLLDRPHTTPLTQHNRSAARPKPDARREQRRAATQEARETISDGYRDIAAGVVERAAQPKPKRQRNQRTKHARQRRKLPREMLEQRRAQRQQRRREQTQQARETINDGLDDVAAAIMRRAEDKQHKTGARPL